MRKRGQEQLRASLTGLIGEVKEFLTGDTRKGRIAPALWFE
jgi:hypothetical protein